MKLFDGSGQAINGDIVAGCMLAFDIDAGTMQVMRCVDDSWEAMRWSSGNDRYFDTRLRRHEMAQALAMFVADKVGCAAHQVDERNGRTFIYELRALVSA